MERNPATYKIVLLGGPHVGKTSIIQQYVLHVFSDDRSETRKADFLQQDCSIDGNRVVLNIWDTAGQETFNSVAPIYYRKASAILIVFDITDRGSFDLAQGWVREVSGQGSLVAIVGNKCDLADQKKMQESEVQKVAEALSVKYYYTSAKSGGGLDDMFASIARQLVLRSSGLKLSRRISPKPIKVKEIPKPKKSCC